MDGGEYLDGWKRVWLGYIVVHVAWWFTVLEHHVTLVVREGGGVTTPVALVVEVHDPCGSDRGRGCTTPLALVVGRGARPLWLWSWEGVHDPRLLWMKGRGEGNVTLGAAGDKTQIYRQPLAVRARGDGEGKLSTPFRHEPLV